MNKHAFLVAVTVLLVAGITYWAFAMGGVAPMPEPANQQDTNQSQAPVTSADGVEPGSGGIHGLPAEPAAEAARADLAAKLGITASAITIMLVEERTWNDGCLGLGGPAESCLQALVDGFRVELRAQGEEYAYRTDKTGASLRLETSVQ